MKASQQTDFINRGVHCPKHGKVHLVIYLTNEAHEYTPSRYACALCWRDAGDPARVSREFRNGEPETWPAPGPIESSDAQWRRLNPEAARAKARADAEHATRIANQAPLGEDWPW